MNKTKKEFNEDIKIYGLKKLIDKMNEAQGNSNKVIHARIKQIEDDQIIKGNMRNYFTKDVDIRRVVGSYHDKYNDSICTWSLFFELPDHMRIEYFDQHLTLIKQNQEYFHNNLPISESRDNVEYVTFDNGETFFIENGNRRTIIAKHYFSAEEFYTGSSDYTIRNVVVHYKKHK